MLISSTHPQNHGPYIIAPVYILHAFVILYHLKNTRIKQITKQPLTTKGNQQ